jgi:hypothetical protein
MIAFVSDWVRDEPVTEKETLITGETTEVGCNAPAAGAGVVCTGTASANGEASGAGSAEGASGMD